jgi:bifunctional N-acetylglucosamine-1-phosphate-uridyltransferase/glucosamine-1-phosphate-acetyltransferase GlmU-like protein
VHRARKAGATLATAVLDNPSGYGRVVREADGSFKTIVEQKDASPEQLKIREVNPSYYCFRSDLLFAALAQVKNTNKQGEYYLTDVPELLKRQGHATAVVEAVPPEDVLSINTPEQLAEVDRILRRRGGSGGTGGTGVNA